jgi:hypothetical protein
MTSKFNYKVAELKEIFKHTKNKDIKYEFITELSCNWRTADRTKELYKWFEKKRRKKNLKEKLISLNKCKDWSIEKKTGNHKHVSGEFFTIEGLRTYNSINREVGKGGWDQPMISKLDIMVKY